MMKRITFAAAIVVAIAMVEATQATTVTWVGGNGTWYLGTGNWSPDYSALNCTGSCGGGDIRAVIDGAGSIVYYNGDTAGDFGWRYGTSTGIAVSGGATFNMETDVYEDGAWMQFEGNHFNVTGAGSLFSRFNTANVTAGTGLNGGALIFGSWKSTAGQTTNINVLDGGELRNKGQTWFGAYGDEDLLNNTLTIGENALFSNNGALEGGASLDNSAGGEGEFNFIYTAPSTAGPHAHNYAWNFTGHNGQIKLGEEGARVQVQDGSGVWTSNLVTYEQMYEGVATGKSADDALLSYDGNNGNNSGAVFADYFQSTAGLAGFTGGQDLRSIAGILQGGTVAGDLNEDGFRDAVDFGIIAGNFSSPGPHTTKDGDINWTAASGTGGDDLIDAADIGVLFSNWTGDHLPEAIPGTAIACYDPWTGEIEIDVNNVVNWYIEEVGDAVMTGDEPAGLNPAYGLITNNDVRIGQSGFAPMSYNQHSLGNVAATGLPFSGNMHIFWNATLGGELQSAPFDCIPEPSTLAFAALSLCGVLATRRRAA